MNVTYHDMVKKARALKSSEGTDKITVAVGGNCNTDFLLPGLNVKLATLNLASDIINLEYDSWLQIAQKNTLEADIWVIWLSSLGATQGGTKRFSFDLDNIMNTITYLVNNKKKVILILPERMEICADYYSPLFQEYQLVKNQIISMLPAEVLIVDPEMIHSSLGDMDWYAARYWSSSKVPCHPDAVATLSWYIGNLVAKSIKPEVKAVVVDLDNTLWGGVVGEDGSSNLLLDVNAEGRPFIQMQFLLKYLSEHGIPISVVSKNNLEDAKLPFLTNPDMLLNLDDFVYFTANWEHKSKNIQDIATKLKLNVDSICFIDDSVYERTEVKAALPNLIVPDLPDDPDDRVGMLLHSGLFTTPYLSKEDMERAKYYKADIKREEFFSETIDFNQYLDGLAMVLEPILIDDTNIQRVVSLIHRTNQFNLTSRRHTMEDIITMINDPCTYAYCYRLKDKFADSGIIGVLIAKTISKRMVIDTFLMSCRVLNRRIEYAIYDHFIEWAKHNNINTIEGKYIRSAKNTLVQDLYLNLGLDMISTNENSTFYSTNQLIASITRPNRASINYLTMPPSFHTFKNGFSNQNRGDCVYH